MKSHELPEVLEPRDNPDDLWYWSPLQSIPVTTLMTPLEIDELWFKLGGGSCDCGFIDKTDTSLAKPEGGPFFPT